METLKITVDKEHPSIESLSEAIRLIKEGGLVAFPTETVYGLGGDAKNPEASKKSMPPRVDLPITL